MSPECLSGTLLASLVATFIGRRSPNPPILSGKNENGNRAEKGRAVHTRREKNDSRGHASP